MTLNEQVADMLNTDTATAAMIAGSAREIVNEGFADEHDFAERTLRRYQSKVETLAEQALEHCHNARTGENIASVKREQGRAFLRMMAHAVKAES